MKIIKKIKLIKPDCGIVEMVKDSVTFDGLKRILYENYKEFNGINDFFTKYYGN